MTASPLCVACGVERRAIAIEPISVLATFTAKQRAVRILGYPAQAPEVSPPMGLGRCFR
jgi:hypothetical protein